MSRLRSSHATILIAQSSFQVQVKTLLHQGDGGGIEELCVTPLSQNGKLRVRPVAVMSLQPLVACHLQ